MLGITLCLSLASTKIGSRESPNSLSPEFRVDASCPSFLASACHWHSQRKRQVAIEELMTFAANLEAFKVVSAEAKENSFATIILLRSW